MKNIQNMSVIADPHIYQLREHLGNDFYISFLDDTLTNGFLNSEKALLVRTVTKVNQEFIDKLPKSISFVGTASAGFDHIDRNYLKKKNIRFAHAPGCNSKAVAEYLMTGILLWSERFGVDLNTKKLGIIGVGHVGKEVNKLVQRFGLKTILYDPPKEKRSKSFKSADFKEILSCDLLTFHVPLDKKTRNYFSESKFGNTTFDLVINAARGGIVDENYLLNQLKDGLVKTCIIDCWENEPISNPELVQKSFIATPHIAGYSEQAKIRATSMITKALQKHFKIKSTKISRAVIPNSIVIDGNKNLTELLTKIHPIREYDESLRLIIQENKDKQPQLFSHIRTNRPFRFEFQALKVQGVEHKYHETLRLLGVKKIRS